MTDIITKACIGKIINNLITNANSISWLNYRPKYNSITRNENFSLVYSNVILNMPYGSNEHHTLANQIAANTNNKFVTYSWVTFAVSQIIVDILNI